MKVSLWAEIRRLHEVERLSKRAIADRLQCCHTTVTKAMAMQEPPGQRTAPAGKSKLDAYKVKIDNLIARYPNLSAVRVREEISKGEDGYRGGITLVKDYLHAIRPARGRVYREVFYDAGEAIQVDWGECGRLKIGNTSRRVSVLVSVLCYSRLCYIEFSLSERKADFLSLRGELAELFRRLPSQDHFRQPEDRRDQRFGKVCHLSSRVSRTLWALLHAATGLRGQRSGIQGHRRNECPLCETECPARA